MSDTTPKICPGADTDTEIVCIGQYIPDYDEPIVMANFLTFKPNRAEGEAALRPPHDHPGRPANALPQSFFAAPTSLPGQYVPQEAANPEGHRYFSENAYVRNNEPDVPAVLEKAFTTLPSRKSFAMYFSMTPTSRRPHYEAAPSKSSKSSSSSSLREGGAAAAAAEEDLAGTMALSMHTDHYFALYTIWEDEGDDEGMVGWVRDVMAGVERHAEGSYLGDADFQTRRTRFWRDDNARRLMEIRRRWDPQGRICGYLDEGDKSGVEGLKNEFEWK